MQAAEESGEFTYVPPSPEKDDDEDRPGVNVAGTKSGADDDEGRVSPEPTPEIDHVSQKTVGPILCAPLLLLLLLLLLLKGALCTGRPPTWKSPGI